MPKVDEAGPYWSTSDGRVRLWLGDVVEQLALMPERSVQACVTSPPYWGLRDYGTGKWEGGRADCDHLQPRGVPRAERRQPWETTGVSKGGSTHEAQEAKQYVDTCRKCGAKRTDHQIGAEPSPDCGTDGQAQCGRCFVCKMVQVFRGVRRVLRDDAILFLNLGDTFASGSTGARPSMGKIEGYGGNRDGAPKVVGLSSGNLVGIPWRVALALQADGWILRQDIIWAKLSPMPESVRNRCTKSHEHVFVFAKQAGYYWDAEAIREQVSALNTGTVSVAPHGDHVLAAGHRRQETREYDRICGANKRDVWNVDDERTLLEWMAANHPDELAAFLGQATNKTDVWRLSSGGGYAGSHFATFSDKLITPMILAASSERGCCAECGSPWERVEDVGKNGGWADKYAAEQNDFLPRGGGIRGKRVDGADNPACRTTIGWQPTCTCNGRFTDEIVKVRKLISVERLGEDGSQGDRDRSLPQNRNGITGSLDGVPRGEEWTLEQRRTYKPHIPLDEHPVVPCTILDVFMGSGTTALACLALGRRAVGIDLSEEYMREHAIARVKAWLVNNSKQAVASQAPVVGRRK